MNVASFRQSAAQRLLDNYSDIILLHRFDGYVDGDSFGASLAVVGNDILVGAPSDDTGATDAGRAYLFDGSTWELLETFDNPDPQAHDHFGSSVAGVGNYVVIGANQSNNPGPGVAYLFAPIPEPSTLVMLLGVGLLGMTAYARRRRKRRT